MNSWLYTYKDSRDDLLGAIINIYVKGIKLLSISLISFTMLVCGTFACTADGTCATDCPAPPNIGVQNRPWCTDGAEKGTIRVTTNIPGSWTVSGTQTFSGSGTFQNVTMPVGVYTIIWGAIDGYVTPPSQTQTLADNGGVISFAGTYVTMPTVNLYFSLFEALKSLVVSLTS